MPARVTKLLHVEDSMLPRRILAQQLADVKDYSFAITCVATEDEAVLEFRRGGFDCVILDYHLSQGNGLGCLRQLRQLDAIVPIIAVSGEATAEIAAELLRVGADDYISKTELLTGAVTRSLCAALARADAVRVYQPTDRREQPAAAALFQELCRTFAAVVGPEFLDRLDRFETAARQEGATVERIEEWFQTACNGQASIRPAGPGSIQRLLRPVLLEALLRLAGESPSESTRA